MAELRIEKVVGALPATLTANTIYLVRTGLGYVQYVTDATGGVAHTMNLPEIQPPAVLINPTELTAPQFSQHQLTAVFETSSADRTVSLTSDIPDGSILVISNIGFGKITISGGHSCEINGAGRVAFMKAGGEWTPISILHGGAAL